MPGLFNPESNLETAEVKIVFFDEAGENFFEKQTIYTHKRNTIIFQEIYLILEKTLALLLFFMVLTHTKFKKQGHILPIEAISVIVTKHQILEVICMET